MDPLEFPQPKRHLLKLSNKRAKNNLLCQNMNESALSGVGNEPEFTRKYFQIRPGFVSIMKRMVQ